MQAMVLAVPMTLQVPIEGARRPLISSISAGVDVAGAMLRPEAAAIGAGAEDFAAVMADDHGTGRQDDGGEVDAGGGHDLRGKGLVAAADEHHGVHGLGADHLLGIHGHEVAQKHGGGVAKLSPMEMVGKTMGRAPASMHAALDAFDESRAHCRGRD